MREILFRAKRLGDGEWVDGNLFVPDNPGYDTKICCGTNVVRINYAVDPNTVGQYIGCCDRNGKKIFEGDIVEIAEYYVFGRLGRFVITYEYSSFYYTSVKRYKDKLPGDPIDDCEYGIVLSGYKVIGNIHDNPELLEE